MKRVVMCCAGLLLITSPAALAAGPRGGGGGGKIVFASNRADGERELYVVDADGSGEHRLTFDDLFERGPRGRRTAAASRSPAALPTGPGTSTRLTPPAAASHG